MFESSSMKLVFPGASTRHDAGSGRTASCWNTNLAENLQVASSKHSAGAGADGNEISNTPLPPHLSPLSLSRRPITFICDACRHLGGRDAPRTVLPGREQHHLRPALAAGARRKQREAQHVATGVCLYANGMRHDCRIDLWPIYIIIYPKFPRAQKRCGALRNKAARITKDFFLPIVYIQFLFIERIFKMRGTASLLAVLLLSVGSAVATSYYQNNGESLHGKICGNAIMCCHTNALY